VQLAQTCNSHNGPLAAPGIGRSVTTSMEDC